MERDPPVPLVLLGRLADGDMPPRRAATWQSTLARIGPDGTLSDDLAADLAAELRVWGW